MTTKRQTWASSSLTLTCQFAGPQLLRQKLQLLAWLASGGRFQCSKSGECENIVRFSLRDKRKMVVRSFYDRTSRAERKKYIYIYIYIFKNLPIGELDVTTPAAGSSVDPRPTLCCCCCLCPSASLFRRMGFGWAGARRLAMSV